MGLIGKTQNYDRSRPLNRWPLFDVDRRLAGYKKQLRREMKAYGLSYDFHLWVSDEWFCPDGVPGFALPFYLFNPQLMQIHRQETGTVEGKNDSEILKLMRHELGHAIDNAFALRRDPDRQRVFGSPHTEYPVAYSPRVYSRNYVHYLGESYAQSHPDEDFAETFAYWLDPHKKWRMKGFSRTLTEKLNCMDRLMRKVRSQQPVLKNQFRIDPIEKNKTPIGEFYRDFHQQRSSAALKRVDHELRQAFQWPGEKSVSLSFFLRKEKHSLKKKLSEDEGVYLYEAERALHKIIKRAESLQIKGSVQEFHRKTPELLKKNFRVLREQQQLKIYL
jgi:hypothetical protein